MHWRRATEVASAIAARWTTERGPGGAILLFDADDIRAEACGGLASLELDVAFTAETATRYASISKHFLAALLVRDEGIWSLDESLGVHLPGLPPALAAVPLGRALDMTSGLPDLMETQWLLGVPWTARLDRHALLRFACRLDALNSVRAQRNFLQQHRLPADRGGAGARSIPAGDDAARAFLRPAGASIRLAEDETEPVPGLATGYWTQRNRLAARPLRPEFLRVGRACRQRARSGRLAAGAHDGRAPAEDLLRPPRRTPSSDRRARTGYGLGLAPFDCHRHNL